MSAWKVRLALATLAMAVGWGPSVAVAETGSRLVLLPVVVHTATSDPTYVSQGLSDMLSARIEQHGYLTVVRKDEAALATTELDAALEAARAAGGDFVLFGSFTQFGDGASLDLHCAPVSAGAAEARHIFIQSGTMGEIIPRLDDVADKLDRYVRGELPPTQVTGATPVRPDLSSQALEELKQRLEVLEQAVFPPTPPVAEETPPSEAVAEETPPSEAVAQTPES